MLGMIARMHLWQQLAMTLKSGVRIADALKQVAAGTGAAARLARELHDADRGSLSESMAAVTGFGAMELAIIEAGEKGGRLPEACLHLVKYLKGRKQTVTSLILKMAYPVMIMHLAVFAGAFSQNALSSGSSAVAYVSSMLWPAYTVAFLVFILPFWLRRKSPAAGLVIDRFLVSCPLLGRYFVQGTEGQFFWFLGTLLSSGVDVREAVGFAAGRVDSYLLRRELREVHEKISEGEPLGASLREVRTLSPQAVARIQAAEMSGQMSDVMQFLFQEAEEGHRHLGHGLIGAMWLFAMFLAGLYVCWVGIGVFTAIMDRAR